MKKFLTRFPLGIKIVVLGVLISTIVWFCLDYIHSHQFRNYAESELSEELGRNLRSSRQKMNEYKSQFYAVNLMLSEEECLASYVDTISDRGSEGTFYQYHKKLPQWLPPQNRWRSVLPNHFFLISYDGRFKEIYTPIGEKLTNEEIESIPYLIPKAIGQVLLTEIAGTPYFLSAAKVDITMKSHKIYLVLLKKIDDEWMRHVFPYTAEDDLPVVLISGTPPRIVASNINESIKKGDLLEDLSHKFIIARKGFEDYGSAEVDLHLAILVEKSRAREFSDRLLSKDRGMRLSLAILLVLALLGFTMLWVRKVESLTKDVGEFVKDELEENIQSLEKGDEMEILRNSLQFMMENIRTTLKQLQESEIRYRSIIENAAEGIFQNTSDCRLLSANARMAEILCYDSPQELIESEPDKNGLFYVDAKRREHLFNLLKQGNIVTNYELELYKKNGEKIWGSLNARPVFDEKGNFVFLEGFLNDISLRREAEAEREKLINELQDALKKVKTLSGMLPICASCKKIRDDSGYWTQIESYIRDHSDADFSHGLCPECAKKLYPDVKAKDGNGN